MKQCLLLDRLEFHISCRIAKFWSFMDLIHSGENVTDEELHKHISLVTENEPCVITLSSVSFFNV